MPTKEEREAWKQQLIDNAEQKIVELTDTDKFKHYLDTLSKFHSYSMQNVQLIYSQNPEAQAIAGFKAWQNKFNRTVNKGEKSIRILAPVIKKLTPEDKARLNTTEDTKIVAYRYIPVFDISQTSGEPVLTARDFVKDHLTTNHENVTALYNEFKDYLNKNTDLKVSEKPLAGLDGAKGYFRKDTNEIVIGGDEPDSQLKLKTLYHEFAHSQLHGLNAEYNDRPRPYKETQAEAVAYVAMQNIGIDTGEYSLGYVATWAKDKEVIHNALSEIQSVSKKAIDITDELTQKLGLQEEQKESDNLKAETKQETTSENKQPTNNNNKSLSDRVQAQLNEFIKQNPDMKKPEQEQAQELKM